jgi:hypothetical protein
LFAIVCSGFREIGFAFLVGDCLPMIIAAKPLQTIANHRKLLQTFSKKLPPRPSCPPNHP